MSSNSTTQIQRRVDVIVRRQRLADSLVGLTRVALPLGLLLCAVAILVARLTELPLEIAWVGVVPIPVVLAWAKFRPRSQRAAARLLDQHYDLKDMLGNALELAAGKIRGSVDDGREAFVALLVAEAEERAASLDPKPVVPLTLPKLRFHELLAAGFLGAASLVPLPGDTPIGADGVDPTTALSEAPENTAKPVDMALAEPLRADLRKLKNGEDRAAAVADAVLDILDAYARGELDREAAYAQLEQLEELLQEAEEEFEASIDEDPALLAEGMRRLAEALEQEEITEEAGKALGNGKSDQLEEQLKKAAEQAEQGGDEAEKSLQRAMEAASKALKKSAEQKTGTAEQLAEAERRLKRQKKQPHKDPEEQERRLKKQQKRVEQLRRQHEREQKARDRLEQLRRQAQQAGQKGGQKGQQGAKNRRQGLQKLSRGASGAQKKARQARRLGQARDNYEEARTFVRRSGKQGSQKGKRKQQMKRFSKAAKGEKGKNGKDGKKGKKGNGPTLLVEGDVGDGDPDQMMMMEGQDGQGEGQGEGQEGDGEGGSEFVASSPSNSYGDGSTDPLGDASDMKARHRNVRFNPEHGRGATRAEVISTASQDGFATTRYADVYNDYKSFAQSALDTEALPAAERRRVKRYFQLIQPRR